MTEDASLSRGRNLLKVDGLGCLLLWQSPRIVIAGHGSSEADLALRAGEVPSPLVIAREGEHYLAESNVPFAVNGTLTTSKLLFCGDTIQVCPRGRLRFSRPVAASSTAVLQPTAAGFTRGDIRHLVLMDDSLLFGADGTHFPINSVGAVILLSLLEHQFSIRTFDHGSAQVAPGENTSTLKTDCPHKIEGLNFILSQDDTRPRTPTHAKV